jgi:hypothetical protein
MASIDDVAGVPVTYRRGADSAAFTATPGQSTFRVDDTYAANVRIRSRDFLFQASALLLAGVQSVPQRGDTVEETVGDKLHVHEVLRPDGGEQVWRYSDAGRTRIRVHTKLKEITAT